MPASPSATLLVSPFPCLLVWCDATARPQPFRQSYLILLPALAPRPAIEIAGVGDGGGGRRGAEHDDDQAVAAPLAAGDQARAGGFRVARFDPRVPGDRQQPVGRLPDDAALRSVAGRTVGFVLRGTKRIRRTAEAAAAAPVRRARSRAGSVSLFRQARSDSGSGFPPA